MNYQRIYDEMVERAKSRGLNKKLLEGYFECHHIIPRCMNGTNDKSNLVLLTAREHYLCHLLLSKIHPNNYSLICAFKMMLRSSDKHFRYDKISSVQYEIIKRKHSEILSERMHNRIVTDETKKRMSKSGKKKVFTELHKLNLKLNRCDQSGENNPMFGKFHSDETKEKIKNKLSGENNPMFGKFHSDETKEKIKMSNIGKTKTDEYKKHMKELMTGDKNSFFGKKHSDETKKRISEMKKGKTFKFKRYQINGDVYSGINRASKATGYSKEFIKDNFKPLI